MYTCIHVRVQNNFESTCPRIIVFRNRSIDPRIEWNHSAIRIFSSLFFFFIFLLRPIKRTDPIRRAQHESSRSCFVACSVAMQIGGKLTTTNDQLTFRRLHPQLFHAFPDLFEVRVRDPHAIGHEFVARRIGQRAVTPGHHGSAAFLASGHLNCSQDNTHG